jgi:hypothetical protein
MEILTEDIVEFFTNEGDMGMINNILGNTKRYISLFSEAVDTIMPGRLSEPQDELESPEEIIMQQRKINLENIESNQVALSAVRGAKHRIPDQLSRT